MMIAASLRPILKALAHILKPTVARLTSGPDSHQDPTLKRDGVGEQVIITEMVNPI